MSKIKLKDCPEVRKTWRAVQDAAREVAGWPAWKRALVSVVKRDGRREGLAQADRCHLDL